MCERLVPENVKSLMVVAYEKFCKIDAVYSIACRRRIVREGYGIDSISCLSGVFEYGNNIYNKNLRILINIKPE